MSNPNLSRQANRKARQSHTRKQDGLVAHRKSLPESCLKITIPKPAAYLKELVGSCEPQFSEQGTSVSTGGIAGVKAQAVCFMDQNLSNLSGLGRGTPPAL